MPKIQLIQTNFTAGEISPRLNGRVDIQRYGNGAKKIENGIVLIHGGCIRRYGSRYIAKAKYHDKPIRLISYIFNRQQAYVLEFGEKYMRVFQNGGQIQKNGQPYEIETPYLAKDLQYVNFVQGADTTFFVHEDYPVHQLQRFEHDDWKLGKTDFSVVPFDEITPTPDCFCLPDKKEPIGETINLTLSDTLGGKALTDSGWNKDRDIGAYVKINRGLVKITKVTDKRNATGEIRAALDATVASPSGAWTRNHAVWDDEQGYPGAVTLHEQRLVLAGSRNHPQTVWLSRTGDYFNFEIGTDDDDAASFKIFSNQPNPIYHMSQTRALIALTLGGEFTIVGGVEKPITPTNIQVRDQSSYGCNGIRPVRIGSELVFVQRSNTKIKSISNGYYGDEYSSTTLTTLSEHITEPGIHEMAYQQEPESLLWMVLNNGQLATLTIDKEQDVIGWSRHVTDGRFLSIASIPSENADEVYIAVQREVNGQSFNYIERLDRSIYTDSAITGEDVDGARVWSGLDHLEGKAVDIVADGVVMSPEMVVNGEVEIDRKAFKVEIGLHYDTTIETLTPEVQTGEGSVQGTQMSINEVTLRLLNTTGVEVNGNVVPFRNFGKSVLDKPAPLFTGDVHVAKLGWAKGEARNLIQQRQPLPFHLLAVIISFTTNGG